jgi:hypothetical protein
VLCPTCGGVLDTATSLKEVHKEPYECALCSRSFELSLDGSMAICSDLRAHARAREIIEEFGSGSIALPARPTVSSLTLRRMQRRSLVPDPAIERRMTHSQGSNSVAKDSGLIVSHPRLFQGHSTSRPRQTNAVRYTAMNPEPFISGADAKRARGRHRLGLASASSASALSLSL